MMLQIKNGVIGDCVWSLGLFFCVSVAGAQEAGVEPIPRAELVEEVEAVADERPVFREDGEVISYSKQFRVMGGDMASRGLAANMAEETKEEFLRLTGEKDEWKVGVVVELRGEVGEAIPKRDTVIDLFDNERAYELKVFYHLSRGLRKQSFKRAVLTALLYERALREREKVVRDAPLNVPPWLVEGLEEATSWRLKESDRRLYDALFRHGGFFKLDDLFVLAEEDYGRMDAASKAAFRVSAGALVMALLDQPEGKASMRSFLAELPAYEGEMPALLRKHFPELNLSATSLEKLYELQLANKGSVPLTDVLDVVKTERALEEALRFRYQDEKGLVQVVGLSEWESLSGLGKEDKEEAVRMAQDDLLRLSYRCFPSYRPLLLEYQEVLAKITNEETKDIAKTMEGLAETRRNMVAKAERAKDFMDYFEITRARETSGEFEDYLKLKARLKENPKQRKDGMSEYLDLLDPLFYVPEEENTDFSAGAEILPY
jgi:hypothetical protein